MPNCRFCGRDNLEWVDTNRFEHNPNLTAAQNQQIMNTLVPRPRLYTAQIGGELHECDLAAFYYRARARNNAAVQASVEQYIGTTCAPRSLQTYQTWLETNSMNSAYESLARNANVVQPSAGSFGSSEITIDTYISPQEQRELANTLNSMWSQIARAGPYTDATTSNVRSSIRAIAEAANIPLPADHFEEDEDGGEPIEELNDSTVIAWAGAWDSTTVYIPGDIVNFNLAYFTACRRSKNVNPTDRVGYGQNRYWEYTKNSHMRTLMTILDNFKQIRSVHNTQPTGQRAIKL